MKFRSFFSYTLYIFIMLGFSPIFSQEKITREEYIKTNAELAMKEMKRTGIPASITLAQGCLESDNGNSYLAIKGNNHFGIKCHDWDGPKIHFDDDEKHECFRKYNSSYDSYVDHSMFLTSKSRYENLFSLDQGDYKGWAKGLKAAGYATSRKYDDMLVKIIEENDLHKYDLMVLSGQEIMGELTGNEPNGELFFDYSRKIKVRNGSEYIIAVNGDTPKTLRSEFDLYPGEIQRYNDLDKGMPIDSGMIIYLQPKKLWADKGKNKHEVQETEQMWDISQKYGIKLRRLYRMNRIPFGVQPSPGTVLNLRRPVRSSTEYIQKKQDKPLKQEDEMQFKFDGS